jgi:hypothetical protein
MINAPYHVTLEGQDVVVRVNTTMMNREGLNRLLDFLRIESLHQHSPLSEDEVAQLADEINRRAWEGIKEKFLGAAS